MIENEKVLAIEAEKVENTDPLEIKEDGEKSDPDKNSDKDPEDDKNS